MKISFGYNNVGPQAEKLVLEVMRSGQHSPGPKVKELEEKFAALHKAKHAVFVNSGTDALRLSLLALKEKNGWKDGDLVAVPALTFVATVNIILQVGLKPYFVDVGMLDYNINPWNLEHRLQTSNLYHRLKCVIPVHLFGQQCDPEIYKMAKKYHWAVLEDSCESILNPIKGDIACFSTYMAHHMTTGVGGFALTNDVNLNLMIRSLANHGRHTAYIPGYCTWKLDKELLKRRFLFMRSGYSCRGTELQAALGLSQMHGLADNLNFRKQVAKQLSDGLSSLNEFLRLPSQIDSHAWMMYPIVLRGPYPPDKYDLCLHLENLGIETRDMMPITNQPCFKELVDANDYSVADEINKRGFYIPCRPGLKPRHVAYIVSAFESFFVKQESVSVAAA